MLDGIVEQKNNIRGKVKISKKYIPVIYKVTQQKHSHTYKMTSGQRYLYSIGLNSKSKLHRVSIVEHFYN